MTDTIAQRLTKKYPHLATVWAARDKKGRETYGRPLEVGSVPSRELATHALEEVADLMMYLEALEAGLGKPVLYDPEWDALEGLARFLRIFHDDR